MEDPLPELPQNPPQPERYVVGYCRACGKALDEAAVRQSHGTIYCAEHVPQEIPLPNSQTYTASYTASPYATPVPPPIPTVTPDPSASPGLAFLLGLIPGVGAIYNRQYAKGLVHALILGMLFTIAESGGAEALMAVTIPGFFFYMAFEAYHTAQKRRLGQPVEEFSGLMTAGSSVSRVPVAAIVLIAFGTLFLLNNLELLEIRRIVRYWPVLLIVGGIAMLVNRMKSGGDGQ
jgi:hypothetical protein